MDILFDVNAEVAVFSTTMVICIIIAGISSFFSYKGYLWKRENKEIAKQYTSGTYKEYWYYYRGYFWFLMAIVTAGMAIVSLLLAVNA